MIRIVHPVALIAINSITISRIAKMISPTDSSNWEVPDNGSKTKGECDNEKTIFNNHIFSWFTFNAESTVNNHTQQDY